MTRLSSLRSVARLVSAAPREACRAVGFERAMLSHIRGDRVSFASVSFEADPIMAADFARLACAVRPRLDRCAPSTRPSSARLPVRTRRPPPAVPPADPRRAHAAYVVAPIVRDGHTVGLLHADHFGTPRELDELDRELLWTFATGIGWAMDDMTGRSLRQHATPATTAPPGGSPRSAAAATSSTSSSRRPPPPGQPDRREIEVLQLMSEGASERRDRPGARHLPGDGQVARPPHPAQARRREPDGGREPVPGDGPTAGRR